MVKLLVVDMRKLGKNIFIKYLLTSVLGTALGFICHEEISSFIPNYTDSAGIIKTPESSYRKGREDTETSNGQIRQVRYAPKIDLCFTPPANCAGSIVSAINGAQSSIYVQAYGLTHLQILAALVNAKHRGVEVRVLLDRSNLSQRHSGYSKLREADIETTIDKVPGIAHNKVMIIDEFITVTGSFNFTASADTRNAENVLIIEDKNIAEEYLKNWLYRKSLNSKTY